MANEPPNSDDDKIVSLEKRLAEARKDFDEEYNPKPKKSLKSDESYNAGVEFIGSIIGGGLLGYALDYFLNTMPLFLIIFIILGFFTGFYNIYKISTNAGTSVGYKGLKSDQKNAKQTSNFEESKNSDLNNYDDDD